MIGLPIYLGSGFWQQDRRLAGKSVDQFRGQNIPSNAKSIDRTEGLNCVISHKSTDLRLQSYQSASNVYSLGTSFVRMLLAYQGETRRDLKMKATYHLSWALEGHGARRVLEWFVPLQGVTPAQEHALERVVSYAAERGIQVVLYRVTE